MPRYPFGCCIVRFSCSAPFCAVEWVNKVEVGAAHSKPCVLRMRMRRYYWNAYNYTQREIGCLLSWEKKKLRVFFPPSIRKGECDYLNKASMRSHGFIFFGRLKVIRRVVSIHWRLFFRHLLHHCAKTCFEIYSRAEDFTWYESDAGSLLHCTVFLLLMAKNYDDYFHNHVRAVLSLLPLLFALWLLCHVQTSFANGKWCYNTKDKHW